MKAVLVILGATLVALVLLAAVCGFPAVGQADPSTVHTIPAPQP